jgi:hypothetical protein
VDEPGVVERLERLGDRLDRVDALCRGEAFVLLHHDVEAAALDELHRDDRTMLRREHLVQPHEARAARLMHRKHLPFESSQGPPVRVLVDALELERRVPAVVGVRGEEDGPHSAAAEIPPKQPVADPHRWGTGDGSRGLLQLGGNWLSRRLGRQLLTPPCPKPSQPIQDHTGGGTTEALVNPGEGITSRGAAGAAR